MEKMERKVGEKFWDYGVLVECVATDEMTCFGCHYAATVHSKGKKMCFKKHGYVGSCLAKDRDDKTNVKFIALST